MNNKLTTGSLLYMLMLNVYIIFTKTTLKNTASLTSPCRNYKLRSNNIMNEYKKFVWPRAKCKFFAKCKDQEHILWPRTKRT